MDDVMMEDVTTDVTLDIHPELSSVTHSEVALFEQHIHHVLWRRKGFRPCILVSL